MQTILSLNPNQIKGLYQTLTFHKSKDKIGMVLEPLQAMIQLSILGVLPIGTKLAIYENILSLQIPNLVQPISRWYWADKKDDIYFLFQVIKRFIKWYNPNVSKKSPIDLELYKLIIQMSITGLDNLLATYDSAENTAITQVIWMYRNILEHKDPNEIEKTFADKVNIDEVFENIVNIYQPNIIKIIHNSLLIINSEDNDVYKLKYIEGLNTTMFKTNKQIQNWIKVNLTL